MQGLLSPLFIALTFACAVGVPAYAGAMRGRTYATFAAVVLGVSLPGNVIAYARLASLFPDALAPWLQVVFCYGMAATGLHLAHLARARMRGWPFRLGVSVPGQAFLAAGLMAGIWMLALLPLRGLLLALGASEPLEALRWLDLAPYGLAVFSIATSSRPAIESVTVQLGGPEDEHSEAVRRVPVERRRGLAPQNHDALRIMQITDPHLGPWQTVSSLRQTIDRLLVGDPDLVLLTGDFLTMEGMGTPGALSEAFRPLAEISDRCFAIFGNHDHEAPDEVRAALAANRVRLLVDEEVRVETRVRAVQIVGADYVGRGRREHVRNLLVRHPRVEDHLRLLLLHDPLGFRHVPPGEVDLVLSGHTHGGQVGLVSLGLDWTVLSRSAWPDHGLFALGSSRLYVHRGTGFYGFPLRIGVPGEASLMEISG